MEIEMKTKIKRIEEEQKQFTNFNSNHLIIITGTIHLVLLLFFIVMYSIRYYLPNDEWKIIKIVTIVIIIATSLSIILFNYKQKDEKRFKRVRNVYIAIITAFWFIMISIIFI
jgi:amino acid transporter